MFHRYFPIREPIQPHPEMGPDVNYDEAILGLLAMLRARLGGGVNPREMGNELLWLLTAARRSSPPPPSEVKDTFDIYAYLLTVPSCCLSRIHNYLFVRDTDEPELLDLDSPNLFLTEDDWREICGEH